MRVLRRILKLPPVFKSLFRGISVLPVFREIRDIYPLWMFLVVLPNFQVQPYIAICGHRMLLLVVSHTAICGHTQPYICSYVAIHSHRILLFSGLTHSHMWPYTAIDLGCSLSNWLGALFGVVLSCLSNVSIVWFVSPQMCARIMWDHYVHTAIHSHTQPYTAIDLGCLSI